MLSPGPRAIAEPLLLESLIQYKLDVAATWTSATWTDTSSGHNTAGNWNATLTGLSEGVHSISVMATDAAGNTSTGTASFGVDLNPPTLTETSIGSASQTTRNTGFILTGVVSDTDPASVTSGTTPTLTVSVSVNGGAANAASVSGSTWSFTQPKVDGTYSYTITATDVAGKTTSLTRLVLLDSTPPTLTLSSPLSGSWTNSTSLSLTGTDTDGAGSGVIKSYYLIDSIANDHSAEIAAWNGTSGVSAPSSSTSATWTATTGSLSNWTGAATLSGEGLKRVWVVAVDNAGNRVSG